MTKPHHDRLRDVVRAAFLAVHDGWSTDDVLIRDDLNAAFLKRCRDKTDHTAFECNWALLNLRKASGLGPVATKRVVLDHSEYVHAAEFAARHMEDKYRMTTDRVFCDPERRREFDVIAAELAPDIEPYLLRKAALKLRKARKLRPEFVKRVADWQREVLRFDANTLQSNPDLIPRQPGVYLFCDLSGYLYIGEAENLRLRVAKHLDHSDRKALARHLWEQGFDGLIVELHAFNSSSDARLKNHRRAYEADLIRSRSPRFNIQD